MSLKIRMMLVIVAGIAFSLIASTAINTYLSTDEMRGVLLDESKKKLTSSRDLVRAQVEKYFSQIEKQITSLANNVVTREAMTKFDKAFSSYDFDRTKPPSDYKNSVQSYYQKNFLNQYNTVNSDSVNVSEMLSGLSPLTYLFQYDFISNNSNPLGNKDKLYSLKNNTAYNNTHQRYHDTFRHFLNSFGYYDIFLVEPQNGHIVYSVFKELDFATSLKNGPYANTGIGVAYKNALTLSKGQISLTDFASYLPSYNAPASFMSTPIFNGSTLIGVLIFQMPIDALNNIMTQDGNWKERGFGDSGEVYLVGPDNTLRNESRFWVEDSSGYLSILTEKGIQAAKEIELKGTSISLQPVYTPGVKQALSGQNGFDMFEDYRGVPVLSAFGPVSVAGQTWAILSEIDVEEALAPTAKLSGNIIYSGSVVTIIMMLLGAALSVLVIKYLLRPLDELKQQFIELNSSEANLNRRLTMHNIVEFDTVAQNFNIFIEQIQNIIDSVKASTDMITSSTKDLHGITDSSYDAATQQSSQARNITESMTQFNLALQEVSESSASASEYTHSCRESAIENATRAKEAATHVGQLGNDVKEAADTLEQLRDEVDRINSVLSVITSIAEQTNLLALNAAIEAARAGESGRGFAVVADEVRQLASKTQNSTIEIQTNITRLEEVTISSVNSMERSNLSAQKGVTLVQNVSEDLTVLSQKIDELSTINATVASATEEQKVSCDGINDNVSNMKDSSKDLRDASEKIDCAALGLSEVSKSLQALVNKFNV
ncbi:methyl-accepting chemotaxis protein [Vibrio sp. S4M6]|uniref:methyl-accepting chemotaxis protein n=1 Tax=Vibrio sinus TaxID=2946865 RepID=UPI00202A2600|nr:methyl-accepting chemotaxis protein [Vibrio sinus]